MLEFFLALFGGAHYTRRTVASKAEHKRAEREFQETQDRSLHARSIWDSSVTNPELEADLIERINNNDAELSAEVDSVRSNVFKDKSIRMLGDNDSDVALRILMANRGYLTKQDATHGIEMCSPGESAAQVQSRFNNQKAFVQYLDDKLRENGVVYEMYFEGANHLYYPFPGKLTVSPGSVTTVGKIVWKPMISPYAFQNSEMRLKNNGYYDDE